MRNSLMFNLYYSRT